jgi:serine/threonine-protein kinase RIO1
MEQNLQLKSILQRVFGSRERRQYIFGDWGFRRAKRHIVQRTEEIWAEKEFRNLVRLRKARIPAPIPVAFEENTVVMSLIGENGICAPQLNETADLDYERTAEKLRVALRDLVLRAELVHGDLSPYNILIWKNRPFLIDISQAVLVTHPDAAHLLHGDVGKLTSFFEKRGVDPGGFYRLEQSLLGRVQHIVGALPTTATTRDERVRRQKSRAVVSYPTNEVSIPEPNS